MVLIDGHSVAYRSYFAFIRNPLRNSSGRNTSAVFGFANTLRKILNELKPDSCAVVFDAPGRTFRHERFERYKLQRPPVPDELREQLPVIRELVRAWGLPLLEIPGVEADDVIGTLAVRAAAEGSSVVIVTSDKDMLQLVGEQITVYDPWKEIRFGETQVREKLGVGPGQVADLLALSGDASDNVPGVPGVGPKRAVEILQKHGSLSAALEHDPRVSAHIDVARMSRELVEIRTDIELPEGAADMKPVQADTARLAALFEELEFRSLLAEVSQTTRLEVETAGEMDLAVLENARVIGFACDTDGCIWVSLDGRRSFRVRPDLTAGLVRLPVIKAGHGIKEQLKLLRRVGLKLGPPFFDTGVAAWLVDPNRKRYGIEHVAEYYLKTKPVRFDAPTLAAVAYGLHEMLRPQLDAMGLSRVADELEMPLIPVLAGMEDRGVKVDSAVLRQLEAELTAELIRLEHEVWQTAGVEFNIASPKQLGHVLFERLKLARGRRTKTGYSTDQTVLSELARHHPVVSLILRWRELTKLNTTYLRPLQELVDPTTGRIHATFDQTGTSTGRLSAIEPNLQNIPVRTPLGRNVRRAFVAAPGRVLISSDYSQIELRVLAHLSGDERLCEAFAAGEDIHVATAAAIFNISRDAVTDAQRRIAKMVNYGIIYGMGDYGLAWRMDLPRDEARAFVQGYMVKFPGVAKWQRETVENARRDGIVRTISGRIRPVPEVASTNRVVAEAAERAALNAPVQGSAADIIKAAMIRIDRELSGNEGVGIVLQVHDELLLEAEEGKAAAVADVIKDEMERAWPLNVKLTAIINIGHDWSRLH